MTKAAPLTKRKPIRICLRLLGALVLAAVALVPQARAGDAETRCPKGDATLRGAYMSMGGGTIIGVGPTTFIGTAYLDGKGDVVNPFTASNDGTIVSAQLTGTYSVNSDCSGTQTLDGAHFDFRASPDGRKYDFIQTDAGTVVSGSASRVGN